MFELKMKSFLFLFGFIAFANSSLLGAKECTYGPSYWCGSLKNAKQCSAVTHCIKTVWEVSTLPKDDDGVCNLCKEMVLETKKVLLSQETQEAIDQVVNQYCHMIPMKDLVKECISIAEDYSQEFIQALTSDMNPHIVCATVGLCNSVAVDKALLQHGFKPEDSFVPKKDHGQVAVAGAECETCKSYFDEVLPSIHSLPKDELLNALLSMCGRLGSYSDSCKIIVEKHFDQIYTLVTQITNSEEICKFIGVCEGIAVSVPHTGEEPCDYCVSMFTFWREILVANTSKEEFRQMLLQVCGQTGSFESECKSLVDQYYEIVYDAIVSEVKPRELCEAIGVCGKHSIFNKELPVWTLFDMNPSNKLPIVNEIEEQKGKIVGTDEAASYGNGIDVLSYGNSGVISSGKKVGNKDVCIMCEFVLHFLQDALQDKPTRKEIIKELDKVCSLMPHSVGQQCQDYVDAYGDQLISLLINGLDPATICPELGLCPGLSLSQLPKGDSTCVMCEFAVTQLEEMLKDNKTEASIKNALESLCSIMPKSIVDECDDFVDSYTDQLIKLLLSELSPDQICQELGLCKKSSPSTQPTTSKLEQTATCVLCEFIVKELDKLVLDNATMNEIEDGIHRVCMLMPSTLVRDCIGFVEEYAKPLIEMFVVKELKPDFVCRELKLCIDSFTIAMPKAVLMTPGVTKRSSDPATCRACEETLALANVYDDIFGNEPTVALTTETICPLIIEESQLCIDIMETDGTKLLELLKTNSPKKACQIRNYCTKPKGHMVGSSKCTWGPSYWCKSQLHAASCSATQHCTDVVWKGTIPTI